MARGRGHNKVRYRTNRIWPTKLDYGPKIISDYGDITYEERLAFDDYGNSYDPRKHSPDTDYNFPRGSR